MEKHELLGKMVTWTSRGVVKTGEVIAVIHGYKFSKHPEQLLKDTEGFWGKPNHHNSYPTIGQSELKAVVEKYKNSHSIQFGYQKPHLRIDGNPFTGLKKNTSFIIEVKHEDNPDHYKPKLFHPYPKNLRPVED